MSIAVNPIFPVIGAQGVTPGVVLQPGTVIDATVLKVLDANLVRIAIANLSIEVLSEVPLKAGQPCSSRFRRPSRVVKLAIVPQTGDGESTAGSSVPAATSVASLASSVVPPSDETSSAAAARNQCRAEYRGSEDRADRYAARYSRRAAADEYRGVGHFRRRAVGSGETGKPVAAVCKPECRGDVAIAAARVAGSGGEIVVCSSGAQCEIFPATT